MTLQLETPAILLSFSGPHTDAETGPNLDTSFGHIAEARLAQYDYSLIENFIM
jgi:hypothetical protein